MSTRHHSPNGHGEHLAAPLPAPHFPTTVLLPDGATIRDLPDGTSRDGTVRLDAQRAALQHDRLAAQGLASRASELRKSVLAVFATSDDTALDTKLAEAQCLIAEWRAAIDRRQQ